MSKSARTILLVGSLTLALFIEGCSSNTNVDDRPTVGWTGLAINWNNFDVYLEPDIDTLYWFDDNRRVYELEGRDSTSGRLYKAQLAISPVEKDSIIALASEIVADAVKTNDWLTCYAGDNVRIKLTSGATSLSLSYGSVKDWLGLSAKHGRLKAMTFDRFESIPEVLVESR